MADRPGYVYLMRLNEPKQVWECPHKIGRTNDLSARHKMIHVHMPYTVTLVAAIVTDDMHELERMFHEAWRNQRLNGEWFRLETEQIKMFCSMALGSYQIRAGLNAHLVNELAFGLINWQAAVDELDEDLPF